MDLKTIDTNDLVSALLDRAEFAEDVDKLSHFVFHPRYNGYSNRCLLCGEAVEGDNNEDGHADDCAYLRAFLRTEPHRGALAAGIKGA